jgi:Spy/CpxP family protein refolding chaperone
VAGLLIGFAASTLAYRYRILRVPFRSPFERMSRELNLTPAQRQQISDVMSDTRKKVIQLRLDSRRQRHQLFADSYKRMRSVLTPEQQQKFDSSFPPPRDSEGEPSEHSPPPE